MHARCMLVGMVGRVWQINRTTPWRMHWLSHACIPMAWMGHGGEGLRESKGLAVQRETKQESGQACGKRGLYKKPREPEVLDNLT